MSAVTLTSCSGDDGLSHETFVTKANAICAEAGRKMQEIETRYRDNFDGDIKKLTQEAGEVGTEQIVDVLALAPRDAADRALLDEIKRVNDETQRLVKERPTDLRDKLQALAVKATDQMRTQGLTACADQNGTSEESG